MNHAPATLLVLALLAAGCVAPTVETPLDDAAQGVLALQAGALSLLVDAQRAGVSTLRLDAGAESSFATFPPGTLLLDADNRFVPALGPVPLEAGVDVRFVPPYGAERIEVLLDNGETLDLALGERGERLVSGRFAIDEMARQRDMFPHRTPGHASYAASQEYFAAFFESLNMEVEVDPYGTMALEDARLPDGPTRGIGPSSLANVVATKPGTLDPPRYLVVGGHYDVVEATTEGAFDNTGGAVATMALARALANTTTEHTIVFGLWGGEEDGILGSQFWVQTNQEKMPFVDGYYNLDVTPLAFPAPKVDPAPLVVAAGPDAAATGTLHAYAQEIEATWLRSGAEFVYESVVAGQATGAGVNAQSDHTPFMAKGVPVYFTFTQRVEDVFALIHSEKDTLDNLTKYALLGVEGLDSELTPEERAEAEELLARSFETPMYLAFYWFVLTDAGLFEPASPVRTDALA